MTRDLEIKELLNNLGSFESFVVARVLEGYRDGFDDELTFLKACLEAYYGPRSQLKNFFKPAV